MQEQQGGLLRVGDTASAELPLDGSYFPRYRFSAFTGPHQFLCLAIYVPLGACLFALRTIILLVVLVFLTATSCCRGRGYSNHGCSVHHATVALIRLMLVSVTVIELPRVRQPDEKARGLPRVIVSNHISELDAVPLASRWPVRVVAMDYIRTTPVIGWIVGVHDPIYIGQVGNAQSASVSPEKLAEYQQQQRDQLATAVVEGTAGDGAASVLIFPEGVLSNGTKAVLRYQKFVFGLGLPIQPLAIRRQASWFQRSFSPIVVDTARATFMANVLWLFFLVRNNDEFCIQTEKLCIKNEKLCIANEEL